MESPNTWYKVRKFHYPKKHHSSKGICNWQTKMCSHEARCPQNSAVTSTRQEWCISSSFFQILSYCWLCFVFCLFFLQGRGCTYSYCGKYESCDDCVKDPYCGWCDSMQSCLGGFGDGPPGVNCPDWFFYHCYTVGNELHCSNNIQVWTKGEAQGILSHNHGSFLFLYA